MKLLRYITGLFLALFLLAYMPDLAAAFTDTRQHWARPEIDHLQSRDIITGYPDGTYRPEGYISRQEFITLVIKALHGEKEAGVLQKGSSFFQDVNGSWAQGYIELAQEMRIAHGDGHGNFMPLRPVSREEAVSILVNCLGGATGDGGSLDFRDDGNISDWARPAVAYAVESGLVKGFPDGTFRPRQNLSRAEVAVIIEKYLSLQGEKYSFYGNITAINLPLRRAAIVIDGRSQEFELAANLAVYDEASRQPVTDLKLPAKAFFDLNTDGKLSFIMLASDYGSSPVKFEFEQLSAVSGAAVSPEQAVSFAAEGINLKTDYYDAAKAQASLEAAKDAMFADAFRSDSGASGRGQLVAVIDSGVDAGHPDLQKTDQDYAKIVDFIDLSAEGKLKLNLASEENGRLQMGDRQADIPSGTAAGMRWKYAYLPLNFLPDEFGLKTSRLVVARSSKAGGALDTVYIDSDGDMEIKDETAVKVFSSGHQAVSVKGDGNRQFNVVVCSISDKDNYIILGYDALGHGTEVAGIVAANGLVEGVAPDAQLLVIKVMNRLGVAPLKRLESAISLAAERGAAAAVMSLGQYQMNEAERQSLAQTAAAVMKTHGMIVCTAAGNNGPGLGTAADSAGIPGIISVGAYATPRMWKTDYNYQVPDSTLWYFSSIGPSAGGAAAPMLLAPGHCVSTYPLWSGKLYNLDQGTSMAAPYLAGALALMLDANQHRLFSNNHYAVLQALFNGAMTLRNYQAAEQGFGAVDLLRAWMELKRMTTQNQDCVVKQLNPDQNLGAGFYSPAQAAASVSLRLVNTGDENRKFSLGGLAAWLKPEQYSIQVPAHSERNVTIKYDSQNDPGLYSSFLLIDDYSTAGWDLAALETLVVPVKLYDMPGRKWEKEETLNPGVYKRYYFNVPQGVDSLNFRLSVPDSQGRVRMFVISPGGMQESGVFTGAGNENVIVSNINCSHPQPGVWELVVYSSVNLSDFQLEKSKYQITAGIQGEKSSVTLSPDPKYLVSTVVPPFKKGDKVNITLHFWNPGSKLPASGLVSINERLYEIKDGLVKLTLQAESDTINLKIAW